jgi:hypothetical protein
LCDAASPGETLRIDFEEVGGYLVATVRDQGLLGRLDADQCRVLRNALLGLFNKAGVTLLSAQVAQRLEPHGLRYCVTEEGLEVTPVAGGACALYALDGEERMVASGDPNLVKVLPSFAPRELLFRDVPLSWSEWVDVWEAEQAGYAKELLRGLPVWPPHAP